MEFKCSTRKSYQRKWSKKETPPRVLDIIFVQKDLPLLEERKTLEYNRDDMLSIGQFVTADSDAYQVSFEKVQQITLVEDMRQRQESMAKSHLH